LHEEVDDQQDRDGNSKPLGGHSNDDQGGDQLHKQGTSDTPVRHETSIVLFGCYMPSGKVHSPSMHTVVL
jgi:hypothetical protein